MYIVFTIIMTETQQLFRQILLTLDKSDFTIDVLVWG